MKITRENYESFFMDYLDGTLDSSREEEFNAFLYDNPDLEKELREFEDIQVTPEIAEFEFKGSLKKNRLDLSLINDRNFDHFCIARLEGDLDADRQSQFDRYITDNPERRRDFELYLKTKLPHENIPCPDKDRLRRLEIGFLRRHSLWYYISAAASVVIVLAFSFIFIVNRIPEEEVASVMQNSNYPESDITPTQAKEDPPVSAVERQILLENEGEQEAAQPNKEKSDVRSHDSFLSIGQATEPAIDDTKEESEAERENLEFLSRRELSVISIPISGNHLSEAIHEMDMENPDDYLTMRQIFARQIRKGILAEEPDSVRPANITILDLTYAGVRGINRITGSNMQLDRYYDQDGELAAFTFNSNAFSISHEVKK